MKKNCVFYPTKIHRTVLKQPIRIENLIKQKPQGALAEKQMPTERSCFLRVSVITAAIIYAKQDN